ncbi:p43 [Psilogramma increta granulovirus]|uniref:P43 n=1 Tax=Psilogramma increta granulovirus TaxID=2953508 RepID=A0A977TNR0_9BBAC|nr:p43 [Psilogramma increta granulovirus]
MITISTLLTINMNRRVNARKPFLFYNEDYYRDDIPKQYFKSGKLIEFGKYNKIATNKSQCKELVKQFLDYCMPDRCRHKNNKIKMLDRLLGPLLLQQVNHQTTVNQRNEDLYCLKSYETNDNMVLYNWMTKCTGTVNVADNIVWLMREIMKRSPKCNIYFHHYYKLFSQCFPTLLRIDKCKFLLCLRVILNKCMLPKNKGNVTARYKLYIASAVHYYLIDNLRLFLYDIALFVKVRRLLIKHYMHITNTRLNDLCKQFASNGNNIKLHQKLLLKYMMNYQHIEDVSWPSLADIESVVTWNKISTNAIRTWPFDTSKIKNGNRLFTYTGWDCRQRFCRTVHCLLLQRLHINKDGSKVLKYV